MKKNTPSLREKKMYLCWRKKDKRGEKEDLVEEDLAAGESNVEKNVGVCQHLLFHDFFRWIRHCRVAKDWPRLSRMLGDMGAENWVWKRESGYEWAALLLLRAAEMGNRIACAQCGAMQPSGHYHFAFKREERLETQRRSKTKRFWSFV